MVIDLNYTSLNIYMDEPIQKKKRTRGKRRRRPGWEGDDANKATKKDTDKLAKVVFSAQQEDEEEIEIIPEPKKIKKTKFMPIPVKKETGEAGEEEEEKNPVILTQGTHTSNAFVIQSHLLREMHSILNQHFGREDMDYFIHSENTSTLTRPGVRKKYKIVLIEDKNGFKYNIWFDLTALGPFSY